MTSTTAAPTRPVRPVLTRPPRTIGQRFTSRATVVAEAATTPLLPSDYLDLVAPLRSGAPLRGRIVEVRPETADAATIRIKPGADWAGHVPGQFLRLGVDVDGVRQWRAYSLTHGMRRDGHIEITVKAVPGGVVSTHLVRRAQPGTLVHLEQAAGEFVLPTETGKLLFVTAGSGITPVIGMLRNLFPVTDSGVLVSRRPSAFSTNEVRHDIVVLHVAPSEPDSIFLDDLRALDDAGAIQLIARYDDVHGVLDINELESLVPDLTDRATYACGPSGLLDALTAHHEARALPLFLEQFRPSLVEAGEGGAVTLGDVVVEVDGATPILQAGEDNGVLMPSGCRMGICMGCKVPLLEGSVRDLRNGEVTTAVPGETDGIPIQTCISTAAGPCSIDVG